MSQQDTSNVDNTSHDIPDFSSMTVDEFNSFDLDKYLSENMMDTQSNEDVDNTDVDKEQDIDDTDTEDTVVNDTEDTNEVNDTVDSTDSDDDNNVNSNIVDDVDINEAIEFYKSIIGKPIRANKHDVVFEKPEQVIQLIQMGANYTKKMQDLKPYQGAIKALQDAELLGDKDKLNHLIDIAKGDKKAIAAYIKANDIDVSELLDDEDVDYKPTNKIADENELKLSETFDTLRDRGVLEDVTKVINNEFNDENSKAILGKNPRLLVALADDIESGLYDKLIPSVNLEAILNPDKPVFEIYIDKYTQLMKQYEQANNSTVNQVKQSKQVDKKTNNNNNTGKLVNAVSKTPSKSGKRKSKKIPDISTVDFFSMSVEEADKFYNEYLAGLPT